jgi:hypothetical protein
VSFNSLLGYATTTEIARVQVSTDSGGTWQDIYAQAGSGGSGESSFTQHSLSLASYAGKNLLLRFNYDFASGNYNYYLGAEPYIGWCLENIVVTNAQQVVNLTTNATSSTNFVFSPSQAGNYLLEARGVIFTEFPTDLGAAKPVSAVAGATIITLNSLTVSGSQVKIKFTLGSGTASSFHLLQENQLGGAWTTNGTAVLTTNAPGSSFQFTTTNGPAMRFYRVATP